MRVYFDRNFGFRGFSYSLAWFGKLYGWFCVVVGVLWLLLYLPAYPIMFYFVMKNWDKWAVTNQSDLIFHPFTGIKPRVFSMTKGEWKMLMWTWLFAIICLTIITIKENDKTEPNETPVRIEYSTVAGSSRR